MPENGAAQTWRVVASSGIKIRSKAGLGGERLGVFAFGSRFTQIGELSEADNFLWAQHSEGFSAVREVGGEAFAVIDTGENTGEETGSLTTNLSGVHLDPRNAAVNGKPAVEALGDINWVRINYDVSFEQGNTDINAAFQLYEPICRPYLQAGKRVIFVLSHETFGENTQGLPVVRPQEFANFVANIVNQWKAFSRQIVWEIWNEPDLGFNDPAFDPKAPHASVPLTPAEFANLLRLTIQAVRAVDPAAVLISGGLMTGQPDYLAKTLSVLPNDVRLDGIAIHPYGQDPAGRNDRFGPFGDLKTLMRAYRNNAGGIPLYITEWGVLNHPEFPVKDVAAYAQRFLVASEEFAKCAVWFAWADQMHNGYGLVDANQQKKAPLYEVFAA
jgi:hypothetical protein